MVYVYTVNLMGSKMICDIFYFDIIICEKGVAYDYK
jgi:hypothetical protein